MTDQGSLDFAGIQFTDRARQVFVLAGEHAIRLRHDQFAVDHILHGILGVHRGAAAVALDSMQVDRGAIRARLEASHPPGHAPMDRGELPYAPSGLDLLREAMAEARAAGEKVTTAHLLLAALADPEGPMYLALDGAGARVAELIVLLRADWRDEEP